MSDIRKAQQQLKRFVTRNQDGWERPGTQPDLATSARRDGYHSHVRYSIEFAAYAELWRSDVTINGQRIVPPKSMRSAGYYATPAQAAKGCEAMERSQYS